MNTSKLKDPFEALPILFIFYLFLYLKDVGINEGLCVDGICMGLVLDHRSTA